MRDPKRIDRILDLLNRYWKRNPDLRLGQIIGNFTPRTSNLAPGSSYSVEDDVIEKELSFFVGYLERQERDMIAFNSFHVEPSDGDE